MKILKKYFLRGFFSLFPIILTIYIFVFFFNTLDNFLGTYIEKIMNRQIPGVGILATIILIFLTGFIITNVVGQKFVAFVERMIQKIPIVPKVYFGIKQIVQAFSLQGKQMFNKVVLVEYPRRGTYVVGFTTGNSKGEIQNKTKQDIVNVFIPTTPNPTSGMLLLVPDDDIILLDMTVEQGLKLIVSAGVVTPE